VSRRGSPGCTDAPGAEECTPPRSRAEPAPRSGRHATERNRLTLPPASGGRARRRSARSL